MTVSLDVETIISHGYEKISDAVKANEISISDKSCAKCKSAVETKFEYRSHAFIECDEDVDARFELERFPTLISLGGSSFKLAGIADYHADLWSLTTLVASNRAIRGSVWTIWFQSQNKFQKMTPSTRCSAFTFECKLRIRKATTV